MSFPVVLSYVLASLGAAAFLVKVICGKLEAYIAHQRYGYEEPSKLSQSMFLFGLDYIFDFMKQARAHRALEHLNHMHESLGYTFSAYVLGDTFFHTSEPENIKAILADQFEDFELGWKRHRDFSPFLGNGIFTVDGPAWKHSRDLLRPNFTKVELDSSLQSLETHVKNLLVQLPRDGSTVDLQPLFFKLTMDASTEFLFGVSTNSLLPGSQELLEPFSEAFEEAQWGLSLRPRLGALNSFYTSRKFVNACKVVHSYVDNFVHTCLAESTGDEKRVLGSSQTDTTSPKQKYCFLQELAKDVRDPKELRDHALNVLIAGRDTTAGLLAITLFVLARRPDVWSKLRKGVEDLHGQRPTFEQLKEMKYLQFVLKEVLRLWPTTPLNNRHANKDTTLPQGGGAEGRSRVLIRKHQRVTYAVYAMHRRKDLYGPDADEFRPERWESLRPGWNYLPFNGGPRTCLGQQFALTESSYVIVRLIQEFRSIEACDSAPFTELLGLTLASKNGTLVRLTPA